MESFRKRGFLSPKVWSMALIVFLGCVMLLGSQAIFSSSSSSQTFDNVQVFIDTQNVMDNSFQVSAYNSTGGLVSTLQTEYPAASFELPSGEYLLTVVASQPNNYPGPVPLVEPNAAISYPIRISPAEYGYSLFNLAASKSLTIQTAPISNLSTVAIRLHVSYLNGTAAANASVGASIVGGYYWIFESDVVLSSQTDKNGVATLTVPSVPIEVTAWKWLPIFLPKSESTTQVNVGGELVNVSAYWEPTYVGLAGEALIIPPETSANITLKTQTPSYWIMPYGVATPGAATGTGSASPTNSSVAVAKDPSGVPTNQYVSSSNTSSFVTTQTETTSLTSKTVTVTSQVSRINSALEIGIIISMIAAVSSTIVAVRKK